jgi:hypothetical protein
LTIYRDRMVSNAQGTERESTVIDKTVTNKTVPEKMVPRKTVPEKTVPEKTAPEKTALEKTVHMSTGSKKKELNRSIHREPSTNKPVSKQGRPLLGEAIESLTQ